MEMKKVIVLCIVQTFTKKVLWINEKNQMALISSKQRKYNKIYGQI